MSQSRGKNRKFREHIPLGISIPDWNIREGEEVLIDNIFRLSSKYLLFICPWIWENMPEERIEQFANAMINGNIIEALRMCIYRFDGSDDVITKSYLCQDHIDEKNDPKFPRLAVFSSMIWDSAIDYRRKGWRVAVLFYSRKTIS